MVDPMKARSRLTTFRCSNPAEATLITNSQRTTVTHYLDLLFIDITYRFTSTCGGNMIK